jgi:RNA polymerase sigma factor (sigma-70 family)
VLPAPTGDGASDEALLASLALGDVEAATCFVRRHQRRVYGLGFSLVGDRNAAEEIAQEAFLRAWRHASTYDPRRGLVTTWLLTITRNLAIDVLRTRRREPVDTSAMVEMWWPVSAAVPDDPEDAAVVADEFHAVRQALLQLPTEQARALVLAACYGRTAAEIAASEDVPLGTAKTRIRLGLRRVRSLLGSDESPSTEASP